jgi:hypothetical protein
MTFSLEGSTGTCENKISGVTKNKNNTDKKNIPFVILIRSNTL